MSDSPNGNADAYRRYRDSLTRVDGLIVDILRSGHSPLPYDHLNEAASAITELMPLAEELDQSRIFNPRTGYSYEVAERKRTLTKLASNAGYMRKNQEKDIFSEYARQR